METNHQHLREAARHLCQLRAYSHDLFERTVRELPPADLLHLLTCWQLYARESQLRPDGCRSIWFVHTGRGWGKTRTGAEERLDLMEDWGPAYRGLVLNKSIGDARKLNVFGSSGLIACARRRGYEVTYHGTDRRINHPSGAVAFLSTPEKADGDDPRGYECNDFWADEISSWPHAIDTWNSLMYSWRLPAPGNQKRGTVTSTPKPNPITFLLLRSKEYANRVTATQGSTRENLANLDSDMRATLEIFAGTKIGRQEEGGEVLDLSRATIEQEVIHTTRVNTTPELERRVISVDPGIRTAAASQRAKPPDDAGIATLGVANDHAYVLNAYAVAGHREWPRRVVRDFVRYDCDAVIVETNQGGDYIADAVHVAAQELSQELGREIVVPTRNVWARASKQARAEPVGALYERGRVHHVGIFPEAERELTTWVPGMTSPNMLDAIVMGVSHLLLGEHTSSPEAYLYD